MSECLIRIVCDHLNVLNRHNDLNTTMFRHSVKLACTHMIRSELEQNGYACLISTENLSCQSHGFQMFISCSKAKLIDLQDPKLGSKT